MNFIKRLLLPLLIIVIASLIGAANSYGQISQPQVTVIDNFTNFNSRYEITFQISNGNQSALNPAENDSIIVVFNNETTLPNSILPTQITVNGTNASKASDVVITNQRLAIRTPVQVTGVGQNSPTVNLVITKSAGIRNPSNPGVFTIQAATTEEPTLVTSAGYDIFQSNTTVSQAAVTPSPSIENRTAKYTIGFSVGAGGFLTSSETVTIEFPAGTTVPNGGIAGVTFNGTTTGAVGDATTNTVSVSVANEVQNNGSVSIVFSSGSGLRNPPAGTGYQLLVNTSVEPTQVASQSYNISDPANLSFSSVSLANDTANAVTRYDIDFFVGNTGSTLLASRGDKIILTFFAPTRIPSSISATNVTVLNKSNGFSNNPSTIRVDKFTSGGTTDSAQVVITTPIDINNGNEVRVTFNQNAGVQNTAIAGSDSIRAKTTENNESIIINANTISNPFSIVAPTTTITQPSVSLSNAAEGQLSTYNIDFSVGKFGRLVGGLSTIDLTFPTGTDLATISGITVNGTAAPFNTNGLDLSITIPAGLTVENNGSVIATINDITNTVEGTYNLTTSTSTETGDVQSQSYDISNSQITVTTAAIGSSTVNSVSSFGFDFTGATRLTTNAQGNDFVELTFPEGTFLPITIGVGDVSLTGQSVSAVDVDQPNRVLKIFVGSNNKTPTRVDVFASAGIRHPAVPANGIYSVLIATSQDAPGNSPTYDLTGNNTAVVADTAISNPPTFNASTPAYDVVFTTGANGRLIGGTPAGSSTITIRFNDPTTSTSVPTSINSTDVTINGVNAADAAVNGDDITLTLPGGMDIPGNTQITINFASSVGLSNIAAAAGKFTVRVRTSSEVNFSTQTDNLELTDAVNLTVSSLTKTESRINTASGYTIKFSPGTGDGLTADTDTIFVVLPTNTFIPSPFAKTHAAVNGVQTKVNPVVSGTRRLAIITPVNLPAETEATLSLSTLAGILNPTLIKNNYRANISTNKEPTLVPSPTYSTTATSTTVSSASVTPADATPGAVTTYTINFNTGAAGRLIEGTSTITVRFPSGTSFGSLSATINGVTVNTINISGQDVVFALPNLPADSVWNSDNINLNVSGITNPSSTGNFTLRTRTSVETSFVTSQQYNISNIGPVSINLFELTQDTVNQAGDYFFEFTVDGAAGALAANSGTITVIFPASSQVPSSINTPSITVTNNSQGTTDNAAGISTSPINKTVTITTPVDIAGGETVSVNFFITSEVKNPKEPASYQWGLRTSSQQANALTPMRAVQPSFNTGISNLSVATNPQTTGEPVEWTWTFTTGNLGAIEPGIGSIFVDFGEGNAIFNQDPIPSTSVTVNGVQLENPVTRPPNSPFFTSADTTVFQVLVPSTVTIGSNSEVTIVFSTAADIEIDPSLAKRTGKSQGSEPAVIQMASPFEVSSSPEPAATSDASNPLPIELIEFFIVENKDNKPELRWASATEKENFGYFIERKFESAEIQSQWNEVQFIKGQGTTLQRTDYTFTDESVNQAGTYLYRLRQVDFDGTATLFGPVEFDFSAPVQAQLKQNYPNPFNPTTNIVYQLSQAGPVTIKVYNILGREVQTLVNERQQPGQFSVVFDASRLASGVYFVRMNTNGRIMTRKIMLIK